MASEPVDLSLPLLTLVLSAVPLLMLSFRLFGLGRAVELEMQNVNFRGLCLKKC